MNHTSLTFRYNQALKRPKYLQLADALSLWLAQQLPSSADRFPSDRQLAEHLGMGTTTVSKSVNELVRRHLLVRKVGSGTYPASDSLHTSGRLRIGVVHHLPLSFGEDAWCTPVISHWQALGHDLIFLVSSPEGYEKAFADYALNGMLVLGPKPSFYADILRLVEAHYPIVTIGMQNNQHPDIFLGTNHQDFARQALDYLASLGHQRIGFVALASGSGVPERLHGYLEGMFQHHLPVNPNWIVMGYADEHRAMDPGLALSQLFMTEPAPTAVLIARHADISMVYEAIHASGKRIPQDISVLGFDDPDYAKHLTPPLSVLAQPLNDLCDIASRQLGHLLAGKPRETFPDLKPVFIIRESCASCTQP